MFEKKIKATSQFVELPVSALENVVGGMKIQRDNTNPNSNKDRSNTARQNLKQISNLDSASENLSANETRIEDVDMAKEMQNYTQNQLIAAEQDHNRVTVNSQV